MKQPMFATIQLRVSHTSICYHIIGVTANPVSPTNISEKNTYKRLIDMCLYNRK